MLWVLFAVFLKLSKRKSGVWDVVELSGFFS